MNRLPHAPGSRRRTSSLLGPTGLLLASLLGWGTWSGCASEDTVATIVTPDGSVGPFAEEAAPWPGDGEASAGTGDLLPDGGVPDAGTAGQ